MLVSLDSSSAQKVSHAMIHVNGCLITQQGYWNNGNTSCAYYCSEMLLKIVGS